MSGYKYNDGNDLLHKSKSLIKRILAKIVEKIKIIEWLDKKQGQLLGGFKK